MERKDKVFGVHSSAPDCFVLTTEGLVVGIGAHVRVLDPVSLRPISTHQVGQEALIAIHSLPSSRLLTLSHHGLISLLDLNQGCLLTAQQSPDPHHSSVSETGQKAAILTSEGCHIWLITHQKLEFAYKIPGNFLISLIPLSENILSVSISQEKSHKYGISLYKLTTKVNNLPVSFTNGALITHKSSQNRMLMLFSDKIMAVIAMDSLEIVKKFTIEWSNIGNFGFEGEKVYFVPENGTFTVINWREIEGNAGEKEERGVVCVRTSHEWMSKDVFYLHWSEPFLYLCTQNGVFRCEFLQFPSSPLTYISLTFHQSGCTALSVNRESSLLCSGDDNGQVIIWNVESGELVGSYQIVRGR